LSSFGKSNAPDERHLAHLENQMLQTSLIELIGKTKCLRRASFGSFENSTASDERRLVHLENQMPQTSVGWFI
jgi:hypothetical protein